MIAEPVRGRPGRFYVGAVGEVGGADPADRVMARRVFDAVVLGDRLVLRNDATPRDIAGQHVMAFERPIAIRRNGLVVIADRSEQIAAEALARAGGPARKRLALLGITSREPVVVYYYSSRRQMLRALGEDPDEARIRFFSRPPDRLSESPPWTRDIGVLGPALDGKGEWTPLMLAHELTHAYTSRWFARTEHAPTLLAEGLATAVEGGRTYQPLRDELASGDPPTRSRRRSRPGASGAATPPARSVSPTWRAARWSSTCWTAGAWTACATSSGRRRLGPQPGGAGRSGARERGGRLGELRRGWTEFVQTLP